METASLTDHHPPELESCTRCRRIPLTGEHVYDYEHGRMLCELCRSRQKHEPLASRLVHTPAFGQTIKIIDQRRSR